MSKDKGTKSIVILMAPYRPLIIRPIVWCSGVALMTYGLLDIFFHTVGLA